MSDFPNGFILNEAAMYAFQDQDVFPDLVSFSAAIPPHLRALFLIPIQAEFSYATASLASRVASFKVAEGYQPDGGTEEADWFGTKTFVQEDLIDTVPSSDPGSIFDIDGAGGLTHHQDLPSSQDENWQVPSETSYMSDVDVTDSFFRYPYRTEESPVRHSSIFIAPRRFARVAMKPHELEPKAPEKVKTNAKTCSVKLVSYDRRSRVFTFNVGCGNKPRTVRASLSDIDHVAVDCNCPFWRWNGPEFHAKTNSYMLGPQRGTAGPPDQRDPDRKFFLCKHAYSVLARMDEFVQEVVDDSWELSDDEILQRVDSEWDKMQEVAEIPLEEAESDQVEVDWEDPVEDAPEGTEDVADPDEEDSDEDEPSDEDEGDPDEGPESDREESDREESDREEDDGSEDGDSEDDGSEDDESEDSGLNEPEKPGRVT